MRACKEGKEQEKQDTETQCARSKFLKRAHCVFVPLCLCVLLLLFLLDVHETRTVAEGLSLHTDFVENGEQQVRHRRVFRISNMTATFELAGSSAGKNDWKRGVIMLVTVTHGAAIQN